MISLFIMKKLIISLIVGGIFMCIFSLTSEQYLGQVNMDEKHQIPHETTTRSGNTYIKYYSSNSIIKLNHILNYSGLLIFIAGAVLQVFYLRKKS